jgi:Tfp pilus assembly protein PilX
MRFDDFDIHAATSRHAARPRGAAAIMAMLFLVLFVTLSVAMLSLSTTSAQSASNLSDVARAHDAAESGLRFMQYRFMKMQRPKTTIGNISASVARTLWPTLKTAVHDDFSAATVNGQTNWNQMQNAAERPWTLETASMTSSVIRTDGSGATFRLRIAQHPLFSGDPLDERYIRVTSTGTYKSATRSVAMDFKIDKKIKFAVVGKVPIQLGRNTIVEGNVAMANPNKFPPIQMLSDFQHFDATLKTKIQDFEAFLEANHGGYDGRVSVNNTAEYNAATSAGYTDYNTDGFIDEYDLFCKQYDSDGDRKITRQEFTNPATNKVYDENLFTLIDGLSAPLFAGDVIRDGYNDGIIDNRDGYAKIRGALTFAVTAEAWNANLAPKNQTIWDWIVGPIVPTEPGVPPVKFGAPVSEIFDLSPSNFDQCSEGFRARTGTAAGTPVRTATLIANTTVTAADANGGTANEQTPFGSTSYQATYRRPVFRNMTFRNCQIARGTNALFDNCTFEGVTFVDMTHDITNSSTHSGGTVVTDPTAGMTWSKRMRSGSFSNSTVLTSANSYGYTSGNNVRFHNCSFRGPVAGPAATAYTHFTNSWEFTGSTLFDNQVDETATIVAPNTNIEMGSFTNPGAAPSTLKGVVVAGNIDIRGTSVVDGSIIVTGDGAGNTTLSYFGPSDSDSNPTAMPEGGYGRLDIRYNPHRALPDGINIAIDVLPDADTYKEGYSAL